MKETAISVKIIKCTGAKFWYKDMVGSMIEVAKYDKDNYKAVDVSKSSVEFLIKKDDCKLIDG